MDNYGWSIAYPMSALTTTSQRLPNQPTADVHEANLGLLSDFLASLPFFVKVNSGFRTPQVNTAVGGVGSSQHMNGLGVDLAVPTPGITNKDLATYFWYYRDKLPYLDQVIWYTNKGHTHVGICPPASTGCLSDVPRGQFKVLPAGGDWTPSEADLASYGARALIALGPPGGFPFGKAIALGGAVAVSLTALGLMYYFVWRRP